MACAASIVAAEERTVDYLRDVRPILAQNCFQCHGPDEATRQGGLRLDEREGALAELDSGLHAIRPEVPDESELLARVAIDDDSLIMPPDETGKRLMDNEIATLRAWIEQGAPYAKHWAYVKPVRSPPPAVRDTTWPRNPIDHFILARLEAENLTPSAEADKATLIRRAALDLTGLPPSAEEVEAFLNDTAAGAFERLVDRLLAKPAYGERWASMWLDLARYADSQGYAPDGPRTIWRWRDWLIEALNDNMPYDQFTIAQMAGDLFPEPSPADLIATGFHRNTQLNTEGGINLEEFRHAAVVDRVNTTFAVWMGSTFACAQCHTHKYDPFSHREYYQIFAIFNNTDDFNTDEPAVEVARAGLDDEYAQAKQAHAEAQTAWNEVTARQDALQVEWEETLRPAGLPEEIIEIIAVLPERREKKQLDTLQNFHRGLSDEWKQADKRLRSARSKFDAVRTTVPVMREQTPRPSHVYARGDYQSPEEEVTPGVPAVLHAAPEDRPLDRLGLAHWLVAPDNPLTARVAVNRLWQELFGIGLVETAEEFGTQGEPPSHPELLDWLAVEYQTGGWDTKALLRLMVTSAAYRQTAQVTAELAERDPNNRLLGRGPRVRLAAETLRDQSLATAGLLSSTMYGPPVQPPQPSFGLSAAFGGTTDWKPSEGDDRYRRALYTRWRRNLPYPSMVTFDAPDRNVCSVRRMRTNTPLQALVTLNDPAFVECAQGLARRVLAESEADGAVADTAGRARRMLKLAVLREPTPQETAHLMRLYDDAHAALAEQPQQAEALATQPLGPLPEGVNAVEAAAWTVVANVVLNLDEMLNKP